LSRLFLLPLLLWPGPHDRADSLVRQMTLAEKLTLVHGARDPETLGGAGYWPGLPRLGIPPLRLADGPSGINVDQDATALPAPVALAATFDIEAARLFGVVLGREARALGQDIVLAPHVNIVRDPRFRRNHTSLSEDPLLTARVAAAQIAGIQSQGVMAQVKHLAGYNGADDVTIDERALHEIYLPAFEAAVKAGVASVMCSYNKINGKWACENSEIQNGILRGLFGFQGFVTSDWGAVHSPEAISMGADIEMPGREIAGRPGGPYFIEPLKTAVEGGRIPVAAVDQAVKRILRQMERFHLLDGKPARGKIDVEGDAAAAGKIALESAVLLTNRAGALPLDAADLESLAVIGPTAGQLAAGYLGERAWGFEERLVSPLDALRTLAPGAKITYAAGEDWTGVPIPTAALSLDKPAGASLDFQALEAGEYSWNGTLTVPVDGDYTFMVHTSIGQGSEGSGSISIDRKLAVRPGGPGLGGMGAVRKRWSSLLPTVDGRDNARGTLHLSSGAHAITTYASSAGEAPLRIRFAWTTPEMRRAGITAAVTAARGARTALVFACTGQDELIERVAAANPRTIVVLNTSGPLEMPWKDRVRAILEMWYPGQEGGWATAKLLLGKASPSGKLPVTFPRKLDDRPAGRVYDEGIAVGYRWHDQRNIEPLFPFGHGLSYTQFEYSDLAVKGSEVSFTVRNAGSRSAVEVAQLYVGPPPNAPVPMAPKALAGFERLELQPGCGKRVTIRIDARSLSYWSTERRRWVVATGRRVVYVGSSSRDIRLSGALTAQR
jgi:beta-glucosidase